MRRKAMDPCELLGVSAAAAEPASEPPPRLRPPTRAELRAEERAQRPARAVYTPPERVEGFAPAGGPSRKGVNVAWKQLTLF